MELTRTSCTRRQSVRVLDIVIGVETPLRRNGTRGA
jgi:hypothetical protein